MTNAPATEIQRPLVDDLDATAGAGRIDPRILLPVLLQAAAIAFVAIVASTSQTPMIRRPWDPMLLCAVGIAMAQCSLGGIWWARSRGPLYLKTALGVVACAATWAMLLAVLDESRGKPDRAAGWAAAFAIQFVVTAMAAGAIEWLIAFHQGRHQRRFTIMTLLLWTTIIACILAGGRWLAAGFGWTPTNFFSWDYFRHLQTMALMNAALAVCIFACVRLTTGWYGRCAACASLFLSITPLKIGMMWGLFGQNLGASLADIALLSLVHAAFLTLTLGLVEPVPHSP
jgi:hypothetical protein